MPWMIISSCHLRQSGILQEEPFSRNNLGKWTYSFILVYASTCHSLSDDKWDSSFLRTQNVPGLLSCFLPECGHSWPHTWLCCLCRFLALCGVSASGCSWLCDTTRAVGTSVLLQLLQSSYFLLQKLSTPGSFHFIRGLLITPCSTNGCSSPCPQVSLLKRPAQYSLP